MTAGGPLLTKPQTITCVEVIQKHSYGILIQLVSASPTEPTELVSLSQNNNKAVVVFAACYFLFVTCKTEEGLKPPEYQSRK